MESLEELLAVTGGEAVEPWSWPGPRLGGAVEALCGWLDRVPAVGRSEDGSWGLFMQGGWGCRLQLYRVWSEVPVIR